MRYFKELRVELERYLEPNHIDSINKAYEFAKNAHRDQTRRTGEPYIIHPVAAAVILAKMELDYQTIMAALLHDVLEDTHIDKYALIDAFGEDVANLVDGVSKLKQIHFDSKAEAQAENFRKMIMAMVKDIRVIMVKLADRLHNMRTLDALPPAKQKRIAHETLEIYTPMANRLGFHSIFRELQDICFRVLYPIRYRALNSASEKKAIEHNQIFEKIKTTISNKLVQHGITDFSIMGRRKHIYSLYKKMMLKKNSFKEIMDFYGIRIIVEDEDTCYRVLGLVHSLYSPVSKRFKDYIAIPKSNSYQSLHTVLFGPLGIAMEVQIRTHDMHKVANIGIAAHWVYKDFDKKPLGDFVRSITNIQDNAQSAVDFFDRVKGELFPEEVYVFTPKGTIVKLPKDASLVDFAYHVHSEVGNSCVGAKVNGKFSPLSSKLANGQTVEIILSKDARPSESWLNFVCTSTARNKIKHYLKVQQKQEAEDFGNRLLTQELQKYKTNITDIPQGKLNALLKELHLDSMSDLFIAIGIGEQYPRIIAEKLISDNIQQYNQKELPALQIKGTEGMVVHFSKCCRPIPGDLIVGHLCSGRGMNIHVQSCKRVVNYQQHPERYIVLSWSKDVKGEFKVDLMIEVLNKKRVLAGLASIISEANSNIENITLDPRAGHFTKAYLTITVADRNHLAEIVRRIRKLDFIISLTRTRNILSYE